MSKEVTLGFPNKLAKSQLANIKAIARTPFCIEQCGSPPLKIHIYESHVVPMDILLHIT